MGKRGFKDYIKGATPAGTFVWPKLQEADKRFEPKYGVFTVDLDLSGPPAADFQKLIDEQYDIEFDFECAEKGEQLKKYDGRPYGPATDGKEKEIIPGVTRFRFKCKAGGERKDGSEWTKDKVMILGAAGDIEVTEPVWGGTLGRVSYQIVPWWTAALGFGVKLELRGVKVIELVSKGTMSAKDLGFEDEEGYAPPVDATTQPTPAGMEDGDVVGEATGAGTEF